MKNLICVLVAAIMLLSCAFAFAETAYVSVSNSQGELVMAYVPVDLSDADADGAVTIADALTLAHDAAYEGGAAAGFRADDMGYGLCITKLWGEELGSGYGYYVNNASAMNLLDPVADGDHVKAYSFTDMDTWSDTYCYFDANTADGSEISLTLTALSYDADWNLVPNPVAGAVITVDGQDTAAITDAEGKAVLSLEAAGQYLISARSDSMTLVPPVCIATVAAE